MDKQFLVKLLQLHFEHHRKLQEFARKINLSYFEINLLDLVLDAIGIPADNTVEQIEKYGYGDWLEQPDTSSRYWYYQEFEKRVKQGTEVECKLYLENVILTDPYHHLVSNGRNRVNLN